MTDGFTWGIWEPVNVVVFTGIGAGAYGVGLLTYLLNKGRVPRARPAGGAGRRHLLHARRQLDRGRPRPLLERGRPPGGALVEPRLGAPRGRRLRDGVRLRALDRGASRPSSTARPRAARRAGSPFGRRWGPWLERRMPYVIALAILLPTMHQSSLGGLMLLAETKVHPLWHTALLPMLFLVSCLTMGYGAVVVLVTAPEARLERRGRPEAPRRHVEGERGAAAPLRRSCASATSPSPGSSASSAPTRSPPSSSSRWRCSWRRPSCSSSPAVQRSRGAAVRRLAPRPRGRSALPGRHLHRRSTGPRRAGTTSRRSGR